MALMDEMKHDLELELAELKHDEEESRAAGRAEHLRRGGRRFLPQSFALSRRCIACWRRGHGAAASQGRS